VLDVPRTGGEGQEEGHDGKDRHEHACHEHGRVASSLCAIEPATIAGHEPPEQQGE
jgi:hypothetical protein